METPTPQTPQTTVTTTTTVKTPDLETEPPQSTTITKQLPPPLTNGVLKRHKPLHHHHPPPLIISYKECLKNHAAAMGGHAIDGCGEFMPSPTSSPTYPTSLKCAACGCHRNFHRRDPDGPFLNIPSVQHVIEYQPLHRHHPPPPPPPPPPPQPISVAGIRENSISPADSPSPPPISSSYMLLALSSGVSAPPPEITTNFSIPMSTGAIGANSAGKKRFRTKFTTDQKQKMHELAERVDWKMQKKDEDLIIGFLNEIGVEKGVFKVWMHNNKMTFGGKRDSGHQHLDSGSSGGGGGGGVDFFIGRNNQHQQQQQHNDTVSSGGGGGGGNVIGTNGSSSSS